MEEIIKTLNKYVILYVVSLSAILSLHIFACVFLPFVGVYNLIWFLPAIFICWYLFNKMGHNAIDRHHKIHLEQVEEIRKKAKELKKQIEKAKAKTKN